jgi:hypothetical protein
MADDNAQPTVLLYGQAMAMLQDIEAAYQAGVIKGPDDFTQHLRAVLSRYQDIAGTPLYEFDPVVDYEPPLSDKTNAIWRQLHHDLSLLQQQMDISRASAVLTHNFLANEVLKAQSENAKIENRIKVLQLYSDSVDSNTVVFGDNFISQGFIDTSSVAINQQASVDRGNFLTIGPQGEVVNLSANAKVTVMDSSNGILGNNQEIQDPTHAPVDPTTKLPIYAFIAQTNPARDTAALTDGSSDTWLEYEYYKVNDADKKRVGNFGFKYSTGSVITQNGKSTAGYLDWSTGPSNGVLHLDIQLALAEISTTNFITYLPYGLIDNVNGPVLVTLVETSADGSIWVPCSPQNVWIGTDPNLKAARAAANVQTGEMTWSFESRSVGWVRLHLQQPTPIQVPIGHMYYIKASDHSKTPTRVEGPIPPLTNPELYMGPGSYSSDTLIQKREFFTGQRWAICIADFLVEQIQYNPLGIMVSQPLRIGGLVDRVALEADTFVPPDFDSSQQWIQFFVSPDDGLNWFQISRIQDDANGIPEIIAFNDPTPDEFKDPHVSYQTVSNPVDTLRLKIALLRPESATSSTPVVHSYKLKVRKR